jgi:CBS domain containing-hemolysin-like protein
MSYLFWSILLICVLSGGTLFFSVNAITLRTFSRVRLQEAFREANKTDHADQLLERSEELVLACSLYRLILNMCIILLLVGMFAGLHDGRLGLRDYILTFLCSATIFSIFGLAIPHAWAKYAGEKVLSRSYRVLTLFARVVAPALYVLRAYDGLVRRLAGVPESTLQEQQEERQEEFLNGLEQQRMQGVVDEEEQQMIENVLELSESTAGEIMTPRTDIAAVEVNSDLDTVLRTITSAGHTRVPVFEGNIDTIVGLVYAKDLLRQVGRPPEEFRLRERIRQAYFVPETKPLRTLLHEFQNQKLHIAVVLDEYGGTAGVVTLEDILEELVGEITDEYEKSPPEPVMQIDANTIEADARTYVDDLNDKFELNLPENEDYDTIGGFVFSHLGYIPKSGEMFDYGRLKFTVTSAEPRRIRRIRIQQLAGPKT